MNDRQAFEAVIAAAPDDEAPRLVYADWCQERGEEALVRALRHPKAESWVRSWVQFKDVQPGLFSWSVYRTNLSDSLVRLLNLDELLGAMKRYTIRWYDTPAKDITFKWYSFDELLSWRRG